VEQIARGEARHTRETFAEYWERWLERRRHHVATATYAAYEVDGRKRLLPVLGPMPMKAIQTAHVRGLAEELAEHVEAGKIAGKTVNNALTALTVCLNAPSRTG
jgi:Phage integrase, N-terminal SAM-like domain